MAAIVKTKTKKKTKAKPNTHHKPHPPPKSHQEAHKKRESSEARKESKKHSSRSRERRRSENSKKEMEQGPETDSAELEEKELIWDPEVSYVGVPLDLPEEEKEVLGELEPERKLWKTDKPIHDRTKIPKEWNWNTNEPDLARDDIDGHIKRYKERIADGILPIQFQVYLEDWESKRAQRENIKAKFPGKSFEVAQRLSSLYSMKAVFLKRGDDYKQVPNIEALIRAYESGELEWHRGLVTYWSYGKQLCKPRPLNFDEFLQVNKKYGGHESFWAEGALSPTPLSQNINAYAPFQYLTANVNFLRKYNPPIPDSDSIHMDYSIKLLGSKPESSVVFTLVEDTGSDLMMLSKQDIVKMHASHLSNGGRPTTPMPPLAGAAEMILADGTEAALNILLLDINLANPKAPTGYILPRWTTIQCGVVPDNPSGGQPKRISGPWIRKMLFTATVPNGRNDFHVFDTQPGIDRLHRCSSEVQLDPNDRMPQAFRPVKPVQDPYNY